MPPATSNSSAQRTTAPFRFSQVLPALWRHRGKSLLAFCALFSLTSLAMMAADVYQSESKIFVRLGRENVTLDPTATLGESSVVSVPNSREAELNTVVEILNSRAMAECVVERLGVDTILNEKPVSDTNDADLVASAKKQLKAWVSQARDLSQAAGISREMTPHDAAVLHLLEEIVVQPAERSNIIRLKYRSNDPAHAQLVLQTAVELFLDEHIRLNRTPQAHTFLDQQTNRLLTDLQRVETEYTVLKADTGLASPTSQRENLVNRLDRLNTQVLGKQAAVAAAESQMKLLEATLDAIPESRVMEEVSGVGNQGTDGMRQQHYSLQLREKQLAAMYTEDHPKLVEIRQQLEESHRILQAEATTRTQVTTGPDRIKQEMELALLTKQPEHAALLAELDELQTQIASSETELHQLIVREEQVKRLERQIALYEGDYLKYAAALEQTRLDEALGAEKISNIGIVQHATLVSLPVSPQRARILVLAVLLGTIGATSLAVLCDVRDPLIRNEYQLEQLLDVPVLTTVPSLAKRQLIPQQSTAHDSPEPQLRATSQT